MSGPLTNDRAELVPRTSFAGPEVRFDLPGLRVGVAEYEEGPTGCSVFHFPAGAACAVDVRGGSPGTIGGSERVHAICLAGGSAYGLEAATGVAAGLFEAAGYATGWLDIALVSGAIVFDFGRRANAVYPDKRLGRAALDAAAEGRFPIGPRGAGRSATVGKTFDYGEYEPGGQGAAFRAIGGARVAVFTVVNALGAVLDRRGQVVAGHRDPASGERAALLLGLERRLADERPIRPTPGSTTLTVVATDQRLDQRELRQLGRQVHASMARAIQPFHSLLDGDVLYAVTTGAARSETLDSVSLGVVASELAWDAVLAAVRPGGGRA